MTTASPADATTASSASPAEPREAEPVTPALDVDVEPDAAPDLGMFHSGQYRIELVQLLTVSPAIVPLVRPEQLLHLERLYLDAAAVTTDGADAVLDPDDELG